MKMGNEELAIQPETKRALDIELLCLHIPLFAIIYLYASHILAWPLFFLLFYMVEMRIFIGNHDRFHTDMTKRLPRWLEIIAEGIAVSVTPWDEPYDSIRPKHLRHHATHMPGKQPVHDSKTDPHSVFEMGGWWRALIHCIFYEESQLILDVRNRHITPSRWVRSFIYLPVQIWFIVTFGWDVFLGVFLAMRIVGATAWFVFSWGIHHLPVYQFGFSHHIFRIFKWGFQFLNGTRVTEGVLHHATHHAWPGVPPRQLHKFDDAVLKHHTEAPDMIPTQG